MDNKKFTDDAEWFDDLLKQPEVGSEIGPDEHAVNSAGLSSIPDAELEQILQETLGDDWSGEEPAEESEEVPVADFSYTDSGVAPVEEFSMQEAVEDDETTIPRKVRPRRKKGYGLFGLPHLAATAIWIILAVAIGTSLGRLLWVCATDILAFGREDKTVYISITDNDNIDSITNKLHELGLIKYPELFKMYASLSNAEEDISTGTFKLNTLYDYHALVGGMSATSSYRETIEVMIPEGYSCAQIFELLEEKGVCTVEKLEAYSRESMFADYWFLVGVERGNKYTLEGFLFPDTYEFYTNATAKHVFQKMLGRFEDQFDEELKEYIVTLNEKLAEKYRRNGYGQDYIDSHQMKLIDVIKVASMIEKESAHTGENYDVSSVIYNRLTNQKAFPYLQIDATIVYATGDSENIDTSFDTPYNTYLYGGLPPTPISNPGLSAILAALSPADTSYYYYALNPATNEHKFSQTLQEHQNFLNSLK